MTLCCLPSAQMLDSSYSDICSSSVVTFMLFPMNDLGVIVFSSTDHYLSRL